MSQTENYNSVTSDVMSVKENYIPETSDVILILINNGVRP